MLWRSKSLVDVAVEVTGEARNRFAEVLTPEALDFIADLHNSFNGRRIELLQRRAER